MRTISTLVLVLVASTLLAAEPPLSSQTTFSDLLREQVAVGFSKDLQSSMYQFHLVSPDLIARSKEYYNKRQENIAKVRELESNSRRPNRFQSEAQTPERAAENKRIQEEIKKHSRPTSFRVGDVTRRGADYIGIREFGTSREYIIPFSRIEAIVIDHPMGDSN